jgi:hypothetical protein
MPPSKDESDDALTQYVLSPAANFFRFTTFISLKSYLGFREKKLFFKLLRSSVVRAQFCWFRGFGHGWTIANMLAS